MTFLSPTSFINAGSRSSKETPQVLIHPDKRCSFCDTNHAKSSFQSLFWRTGSTLQDGIQEPACLFPPDRALVTGWFNRATGACREAYPPISPTATCATRGATPTCAAPPSPAQVWHSLHTLRPFHALPVCYMNAGCICDPVFVSASLVYNPRGLTASGGVGC